MGGTILIVKVHSMKVNYVTINKGKNSIACKEVRNTYLILDIKRPLDIFEGQIFKTVSWGKYTLAKI
jgi:hypothetical protein